MDTCTFALDALRFASERHAGQTRKGERREPYINHLIEVAHLVSEAAGGADRIAIAAAALHDTMEDTPTTYDELAARFGVEVADVVGEVTDDKALPKAVRKRLQIEHAPFKSSRARLVKIADKTSNLRTLAASPPADWPLARRIEYVCWANGVVDTIRSTHAGLAQRFEAAARDAVFACGATLFDQRLMQLPDRYDLIETICGENRTLPFRQLWALDDRPAAVEMDGDGRIHHGGAWRPFDAWELISEGRPLAFYMFDAAWPGLMAAPDYLATFAPAPA